MTRYNKPKNFYDQYIPVLLLILSCITLHAHTTKQQTVVRTAPVAQTASVDHLAHVQAVDPLNCVHVATLVHVEQSASVDHLARVRAVDPLNRVRVAILVHVEQSASVVHLASALAVDPLNRVHVVIAVAVELTASVGQAASVPRANAEHFKQF